MTGMATTAHAAQPAHVTTDLNMRAGPSTDFPVVSVVSEGTIVTVYRCVRDYSWCDVNADQQRGWVASNYLQRRRGDSYVTWLEYAPSAGFPVYDYEVAPYWNTYYRGRPWYGRRDYWTRTWRSGRGGLPFIGGGRQYRPGRDFDDRYRQRGDRFNGRNFDGGNRGFQGSPRIRPNVGGPNQLRTGDGGGRAFRGNRFGESDGIRRAPNFGGSRGGNGAVIGGGGGGGRSFGGGGGDGGRSFGAGGAGRSFGGGGGGGGRSFGAGGGGGGRSFGGGGGGGGNRGGGGGGDHRR